MNGATIVLISTAVTGVVALLGLSVRYCFLSKCSSMSCCWGCYKHTRNINAELQQHIDEQQYIVNPKEEKLNYTV